MRISQQLQLASTFMAQKVRPHLPEISLSDASYSLDPHLEPNEAKRILEPTIEKYQTFKRALAGMRNYHQRALNASDFEKLFNRHNYGDCNHISTYISLKLEEDGSIKILLPQAFLIIFPKDRLEVLDCCIEVAKKELSVKDATGLTYETVRDFKKSVRKTDFEIFEEKKVADMFATVFNALIGELSSGTTNLNDPSDLPDIVDRLAKEKIEESTILALFEKTDYIQMAPVISLTPGLKEKLESERYLKLNDFGPLKDSIVIDGFVDDVFLGKEIEAKYKTLLERDYGGIEIVLASPNSFLGLIHMTN